VIAADTSTWIAYIQGVEGRDVDLLDAALQQGELLLPPAVLTEILSAASLPERFANLLREVPLLDVQPGFWRRAGLLRATILANRRKAKLGDTLVAQSCIDAKISLITRDADFEPFARYAGLELAV
jgi:predicted nucleic acid-binding protein